MQRIPPRNRPLAQGGIRHSGIRHKVAPSPASTLDGTTLWPKSSGHHHPHEGKYRFPSRTGTARTLELSSRGLRRATNRDDHRRQYKQPTHQPHSTTTLIVATSASVSGHNNIAGLATTEKNNVAQPRLTPLKREKQCCANDLTASRPRCHHRTRFRVSQWRRTPRGTPRRLASHATIPPWNHLPQNGKETLPRQPIPWSPAHRSKRSHARS